MVTGADGRQHEPEDVVAVLTRRGRVVWSPGPPRVSVVKPCAISPTGVSLYRWPMRSTFVPLDRVDRFDVELEKGETGHDYDERLVLYTHDGKSIPVETMATQVLSRWRGIPPRARAQHLNNHILPTWRSASRRDGDPPRPTT